MEVVSRATFAVPGMEAAAFTPFVEVVRSAPNEWVVTAPALEARVELDRCGTWVTLTKTTGTRPVVVRRAGWVDVRGHPSDAPGAVDRVGLGPGDSLVVFGAAWQSRTTAGEIVDDAVLDALLGTTGAGAARQLDAVTGHDGAGAAAVLAVPGDLGAEPLERVAAATGVPVADLDLPGYPLGDAQPDLWQQPPRPPREARLHVRQDPVVVRELRQLLRRLLASWRIEERVAASDVELLATEITSNAIRHAGTTATAIVRYLGRRLRVEVGDGSPALPVRRPASVDATGGRGLPLVDALSADWGVIATRSGKRVWFEVPVTG